MITKEELAKRMEHIHRLSFYMSTQSSSYQKKTLNKIVHITKHAPRDLILKHAPKAIINCALKILLYYDESLLSADNVCRRRKLRLARECYAQLLKTYIPARSQEVIEAVINVVCRDRLWQFETFCFEIMHSLLEYGADGAVMTHAVWNKLESPDMNDQDVRGVVRILCELLNVYNWPATFDTIIVIERILNLFYKSMTTVESTNASVSSAMFKKGLEVCIRNTVKHLSNDHLLIIICHMCGWAVKEGMTDDMILEFGSVLEYTAYTHRVTLYEETLTPKVFPLLMQMISSRSRVINLLGNRVIQYLLDRHENKMFFDTPMIFFENTHFDLTIGPCHQEDILFCKLHREVLHDSFLKSMINHSESRMNLEATYCTICLIAIEVPCGFTAAALVCLTMNLQDLPQKKNEGQVEVTYHRHATVISIMSLICWIHKAKGFYEYVNKIVMERAQWAPHLNPPIQPGYSFAIHHVLWDKPDLFFIDWEVRYGLWKCFRLRDIEEDSILIE